MKNNCKYFVECGDQQIPADTFPEGRAGQKILSSMNPGKEVQLIRTKVVTTMVDGKITEEDTTEV